jgi:hypothetical protein
VVDSLAEAVVALEVGEAYSQLKGLLVQKSCRVVAEELPTGMVAEQGSLWGVTPRTAKKTIRYRLFASNSETRVTVKSQMSSDYVKFTVFGCGFAVALALWCAWLSADLGALAAGQKEGYWSWLVESGGYVNVQGALMLSDLTLAFVFFLAVTLALEAFVVAYVHFKINDFAEDTLKMLIQGQSQSA